MKQNANRKIIKGSQRVYPNGYLQPCFIGFSL